MMWVWMSACIFMMPVYSECEQDMIKLESWIKIFDIKQCDGKLPDGITLQLDGEQRIYKFPPGKFEMKKQVVIPEYSTIEGACDPNNECRNPEDQTIFLASTGATNPNQDGNYKYCLSNERTGFVLSSYSTVKNVHYQGIDTLRPESNQHLCGGAAFETKGCPMQFCWKTSDPGNGREDGSHHVHIENVRLNDLYWKEDMEGKKLDGYHKPKQTIRASQLGIWIPHSRKGSSHITVKNFHSQVSHGDGINVHGNVHNVEMTNLNIFNTGDDGLAIWSAAYPQCCGCEKGKFTEHCDGSHFNQEIAVQNIAHHITFRNVDIRGVPFLRPRFWGHCVSTFGFGKAIVFDNISCKAKLFKDFIPVWKDKPKQYQNSMFAFHCCHWSKHVAPSDVTIKNWKFTDENGKPYKPTDKELDRKMEWIKFDGVEVPIWMENGLNRSVVDVKIIEDKDAAFSIESDQNVDLTLENQGESTDNFY